MKKLFRRYWKKLSEVSLNFLFPVECVMCGGSEDWLCSACLATAPRPTALSCFSCRRPTTDGRWCDECGKGKMTRGIHAAAAYNAPALREGVHALKYRAVRVLAAPLAKLWVQFFTQWPFLFSRAMLFIPVPLHVKKERDRGYNQSHLLLASCLAAMGSGVCGCWLLSRTRHTKQQVDCTPEERRMNVVNAFACRSVGTFPPQRVVIVDDVATTGTTLEECARALRAAGANDIWGLALAR